MISDIYVCSTDSAYQRENQELYRYLIDDFVVQFCQNIREKDFTVKTEELSRSKKAKRKYLNDVKTRELTNRCQ